MKHKKNLTMESEAALLYAMARAMGPYIAQHPGAFDTTAAVVYDVEDLKRPEFKGVKHRFAYRRCGEFGEEDLWARDGDTGLAFCANGHDPYPMADEKMTMDLLRVTIGVLKALLMHSIKPRDDGLYNELSGVALSAVAEVRDFGGFFVHRRRRRRWKNPKNGKWYKGGWSVELVFRPAKASKWFHGSNCNCGGEA